jgi:hypothetical protein
MSEEQSLLPDLEQPLAPSYALSEHSLTYIPELRVGEEVFTYRYASSCSMMSCSAKCCRYGVLVDIAHRDRILSEAALVVQYMEPTQEHDPSRWFDSEVEIDEDFPSGESSIRIRTTTRAFFSTVAAAACCTWPSPRRRG